MDCWNEIRKLKGKTLKTLDHGNPFYIIDVRERRVVVSPHASGKPRPIPREHVEHAFRELVNRGEISRSDIETNYSPRNPAYVAAILASLPGITHVTKAIKLKYREA